MAQNFWIAIFAWSTCFLVTIVVSLATTPQAESKLRGLVYGLTDLPPRRRSLVSAACAVGYGGVRGSRCSEPDLFYKRSSTCSI
jgi:hypothetical protein